MSDGWKHVIESMIALPADQMTAATAPCDEFP
jgi:hypothetical protein